MREWECVEVREWEYVEVREWECVEKRKWEGRLSMSALTLISIIGIRIDAQLNIRLPTGWPVSLPCPLPQLLVNCGSNVFLTNKKEETAADCATKHNHAEIATTLETKMVFRVSEATHGRSLSCGDVYTQGYTNCFLQCTHIAKTSSHKRIQSLFIAQPLPVCTATP